MVMWELTCGGRPSGNVNYLAVNSVACGGEAAAEYASGAKSHKVHQAHSRDSWRGALCGAGAEAHV